MQKDLTTGSVFKNVLYFSLPYLLSYFLQTLYGMADLFIIGRFEGTASITAVSIGSQIMHMITVMLVGLAMGVTVGIGRAVGAHNDRDAGAVIGSAVTLFLAVSVVMAAVLAVPADAYGMQRRGRSVMPADCFCPLSSGCWLPHRCCSWPLPYWRTWG